MGRGPQNIADAAVEDATGHGWDHWFDRLDDDDGTALEHPAIVAALEAAGVASPWWQQRIAVAYEHERGLRTVGETADAGFQVGVQRTLPVDQATLWDRLRSAEGRRLWLGEGGSFDLEPGAAYETADGTVGEVRTVAPGERLRLTWQPADREAPTTLQLTLSCPRNGDTRTTLRIHHEKLADAEEREAMREHWRAVLDELEAQLEG